MKRKQSCTSEELCHGLPEIMIELSKYIWGMQIDEIPNYEYIRSQLIEAAAQENINLPLVESVRDG